MDEPQEFETEVRSFKALGNPFSISPIWNPIAWWKTRHLRHDIKQLEDERSPLSRAIDKELDRAVLCGEDIGS